jgi:hypothetical protein
MKIYQHRFDKKYQKCLSEHLSIDKLIENSIKISKPIERDGKEFNRICRFDYIGISGTTFLDIGCNFISDDTVPIKFTEIIKNAHIFNKQGVFIKIRILLMYPYSTSFFSIIQAESSSHRASVDSPGFLRDFSIVDQVDEATFHASASIKNQRNCLKYLQEIMSDPYWEDESPNSVSIRFTPVNVNFSLLTINNSVFYSPYILSKIKRLKNELALMAPVVQIDHHTDNNSFDQFVDHFRYLWDLDTTMFCKDATTFDSKVSDSLSKILPPSRVSFDAKASKIEKLVKEQTSQSISVNEIHNWKLCLQHILLKYSTDTSPSPNVESLFIACSWKIGNDGKSVPNKYAKYLVQWLESDFWPKHSNPILSVHLLEAASGDSLAQQVYSRLREATLGIVILSKDIKATDGSYFTKLNVLHELGYLMRHLDTRRLVVLCEDNVTVPTNINDKVFIDFQTDKLSLCYREVVLWLNEVSSLTCFANISEALMYHRERLRDFIVDGTLAQSEGEEGSRKIGEDIKCLTNSCT